MRVTAGAVATLAVVTLRWRKGAHNDWWRCILYDPPRSRSSGTGLNSVEEEQKQAQQPLQPAPVQPNGSSVLVAGCATVKL